LDIYILKSRWKLFLFIAATLIGVGSLLYTHQLVKKLSSEERKKVELWADATRLLAQASQSTDLNFLLKVIENNNTVPVILCDEFGRVVYFRNLDSIKASGKEFLQSELSVMKRKNSPIIINLAAGKQKYIYYNSSVYIHTFSW